MAATREYRSITCKCIGLTMRCAILIQRSGEGGAEPEVVKFSGAGHRHFRTLKQAKDFIADWEEMYACVWKEMIKTELERVGRTTTLTTIQVKSALPA